MVMEVVISVVLLIVGVSVLVFIHICIVSRAFRNDARSSSNFPRRANHVPRMNPDDIRQLPCVEYRVDQTEKANSNNSNSDLGNNTMECSICLETFREGEKCRILPSCVHSFHVECIDSWLLKTGACPMCRTGAKSSASSSEFGQHSSSYSGDVGATQLV